jgi:hypothetical protein
MNGRFVHLMVSQGVLGFYPHGDVLHDVWYYVLVSMRCDLSVPQVRTTRNCSGISGASYGPSVRSTSSSPFAFRDRALTTCHTRVLHPNCITAGPHSRTMSMATFRMTTIGLPPSADIRLRWMLRSEAHGATAGPSSDYKTRQLRERDDGASTNELGVGDGDE